MQSALKGNIPYANHASIVTVDRTIGPKYPSYIKDVLYPELELTGPETFSLDDLEALLHPKQRGSRITGEELFVHLRHEQVFSHCLGVHELDAITRIDPEVYRRYFGGRSIFGWKSVAFDRYGYRSAPYVARTQTMRTIAWRRLEFDWDAGSPALLFKDHAVT